MRGFTWSMRRVLNIKITVRGNAEQLERGGYVIISNHFGYLDGIVLGSLFPVIFVSKREVKSWPVVGKWTTLCGTVFINRQRKGLIPLAVKEMSRKLRQGVNILLFPEGAATNGDRLLPFQTAPLAGPLRSRATIVPVNLTYQSIEERPISATNRDLVYCYGGMDFFSHFWKLLALRQVEVKVTIQPKVECSMKTTPQAARNLPRIVTTEFWDECVKEITRKKMWSANRQTRVRPRCRTIDDLGQLQMLKVRVDCIGALSGVCPKRCGGER
jgi:1-acyl-sn-glycerol-3-phosphate acyltransferase